MDGMTIGQVARAAGVGVETIRFYERRGLLDEPPRRASGYRQYSDGAVRQLRFIRRAKELGFSLREIAELLELRAETPTQCEDVRRRLEAKITDIENRIADLHHIKRALAELAATCAAQDPIGACPILEALEKTSGKESSAVG